MVTEDLAPPPDLSVAVPEDGGITPPVFLATSSGMWGGHLVDVAATSATSLFAISQQDLYRSTDAAVSWQRVSPALPLAVDETQEVLSVGTRICIGTSSGRVFCSPIQDALSFAALEPDGDLGTTSLSSIVGLVELSPTTLMVATSSNVLRWNGSAYEPFAQLLPSGTNRALFVGIQVVQATWLVRASGIYYRRASDSGWILAVASTPEAWGFVASLPRIYLPFADGSVTSLVTFDTSLSSTPCKGTVPVQLALGVTESGRLFRRTLATYETAPSCADDWVTIGTDTSSEIALARPFVDTLFGVGSKGLFRIQTATVGPPAEIDTGIEAQLVQCFAAPSDSPSRVFAATGSGIFRYDAGGGTFSRIDSPLGRYLAVSQVHFSPLFPAQGMAIVNEGNPGRLLLTEDHGDTWTASPTTGRIESIAFDPHEDRALGCIDDVLKESRDHGKSWSALKPDGGTTPIDKCRLLVAHPEAGVFFVAAEKDRIWRSTDGGTTWSAWAQGLLPAILFRQLIVDPRSIDRLVVTLVSIGSIEVTATGVVPFYQPGEALLALARDPGNPSILYAAQKGGAAMSTDDGKSWSPIVGAPPKQRTIFVHPADRRQRWVGTEARGAYFSSGDYLP